MYQPHSRIRAPLQHSIVLFVLTATLMLEPGPVQALAATVNSAKDIAQQDNRLGKHEFMSRHYHRAMSLFRTAANAGIIKAETRLGYMYYNGFGTSPNAKKAVDLWTKAAAQGDPRAMYDLGDCYQLGRGCEHSYRLATMWYQRAFSKKLAIAMYAIGALYEAGHYAVGNGQLVQNFPLAEKWYRRAAAKGVATAMYAMGRLYAKGRGVKKDPTLAVNWFRRAAMAGDQTAMKVLSAAYKIGWGVPKNQEKANKWLIKAEGKQLTGKSISSLAQTFISKPLLIKIIPDGFDNNPSEIACTTLRSNGKLLGLGVVVRSVRTMAVMSESMIGEGADAVAMIAIVAHARGAGRQAPAILINGTWQIGGDLGNRVFQYRSESYHYNKVKDIWVPVKRQAQSPNP